MPVDDKQKEIDLNARAAGTSPDLSSERLPPAPDFTTSRVERIRSSASELLDSLKTNYDDKSRIRDQEKAISIIGNSLRNGEYKSLSEEFQKLKIAEARENNFNLGSIYNSENSFLDQEIGRSARLVSGNRLMEARFGKYIADLVEGVKEHQGFTFANSRNNIVETLFKIANSQSGPGVLASLNQAYKVRFPQENLFEVLSDLGRPGIFSSSMAWEVSGIINAFSRSQRPQNQSGL